MQTDGLIDWYDRQDRQWHPTIKTPLHNHQKTIECIQWHKVWAREHHRIQSNKASKEIFKHLKQFSRIQARTSSWRISSYGNEESNEQLPKLNANLLLNEMEPMGRIQVNNQDDFVFMNQREFDSPNDLGGDIEEDKQLIEAKETAKLIQLKEVYFYFL